MRKGRRSILDAYYSLTLSTIDRKPLLANAEVADVIFEAFDWLETNKWCRWFCLVVMPDHIHTVIQLGGNKTLSRLIQSLFEKYFQPTSKSPRVGLRERIATAIEIHEGVVETPKPRAPKPQRGSNEAA